MLFFFILNIQMNSIRACVNNIRVFNNSKKIKYTSFTFIRIDVTAQNNDKSFVKKNIFVFFHSFLQRHLFDSSLYSHYIRPVEYYSIQIESICVLKILDEIFFSEFFDLIRCQNYHHHR